MNAPSSSAKGMRSGVWVLVACVYGLVGVALSFLITRPIPIVEPPWYESVYFPLWAAATLFLVVALCVRLAKAAILGLLATAPPYLSFLVFYLRYSEDVGVERLARIGLLLCFAASGALLNPLLSRLVGIVKRGRDASKAGPGSAR